ncbi:expressed unknown protein [Seminavis robusta]|uniref:DUF6824 domain-containing protein n=1 Tax=Seminavis robusta TaxID=568900 RepID=A0A9N8EBD6_9STRA|nr:expressed unknown protein [Seminavis robusta]|eukprot:Sro705_g190290.1 n/a (486) ;mRNA; r:13517-15102
MTFKTGSKKSEEIDAASKLEENLLEGITHPGLHDCLCGRGGHATNHPGNVQFRMLVNQYKEFYLGLSRCGKLQVAAEVVRLWRAQTPAGRFLAMTDPSQKEQSTWHDIGDKEALKKTTQCLRERIPAHQRARTLKAPIKPTSALNIREELLKKIQHHEAQQQQPSASAPPTQAQSLAQALTTCTNSGAMVPESSSNTGTGTPTSSASGLWAQTQLNLLMNDECTQQELQTAQAPVTSTCTQMQRQTDTVTGPTPLVTQENRAQVQPNLHAILGGLFQQIPRQNNQVASTNANNSAPVPARSRLSQQQVSASSAPFPPPMPKGNRFAATSRTQSLSRETSWAGVSVGSWHDSDELPFQAWEELMEHDATTAASIMGIAPSPVSTTASEESSAHHEKTDQVTAVVPSSFASTSADSAAATSTTDAIPSTANLTHNVFGLGAQWRYRRSSSAEKNVPTRQPQATAAHWTHSLTSMDGSYTMISRQTNH